MTEAFMLGTAALLAFLCIGTLALLLLRLRGAEQALHRCQARLDRIAAAAQAPRVQRRIRREQREMVARGLDEGTATVEELHKTIAGATFQVLDRLATHPRLQDGHRQVQAIHDETVDGVYRSVKTLNRRLSSLSRSLFDRDGD